MKVLFVTPYPHGEAPSQRFRFEQYYNLLDKEGIEYDIAPFLDDATWQILYKPGHTLQKVWGILKGFARRKLLMLRLGKYERVFIHREASPIGPPIFEWWMAKVARKEIIYDFDDAIWLSNTSANNTIVAGIKWHGKVRSISKWAYKVSCGNQYLCDFAKQFNSNVVLNPTTIDTEHLHNQVKDQHTGKIVIGWTGTHSTIQYLDELVPVLQKLEQKYDFEFRVISNRQPQLELKSLKYIEWNKETEIADLLQFNFGLMPLRDDKWAKGKCGFKALQYMSLGMPAIVSPVGVNTTIVDGGVNGFICSTNQEWEQAIEKLLTDADTRIKMGAAARQKIIGHYSVVANSDVFLSLFEE